MSLVYLSMATELAGLWQQHCLEEQGGLCAQHILAWEWVIYPQHGNPLHELCDVASTETRRSCGDALTIIVQGSFLFILWISFPFFISTYFWNIFKQGNGAGRSYFFHWLLILKSILSRQVILLSLVYLVLLCQSKEESLLITKLTS